MEPTTFDPGLTVDEIMRRWPATIRLFIRRRMLCVGCPIGIFHTVKDACGKHGVDEASFSEELLALMTDGQDGSGSVPTGAAGQPHEGPTSSCGFRPPAAIRADPSP